MNLGSYQVTFKGKDNAENEKITETVTILVTDQTEPTYSWSLSGSATYAYTGSAIDLPEPTFTDPQGSPVTVTGPYINGVYTPGSIVNLGSYQVTFKGVDDAGNETITSPVTIVVEDQAAPEFKEWSLSEGDIFTYTGNSIIIDRPVFEDLVTPESELNYSVVYEYKGPVASTYTTIINKEINPIGDYIVTYTCTDQASNTSLAVTRNFKIETDRTGDPTDPSKPSDPLHEYTWNFNDNLVINHTGSSININYYGSPPVYSNANLSVTGPVITKDDGSRPKIIREIGQYAISYTASDGVNAETITRTFFIVDSRMSLRSSSIIKNAQNAQQTQSFVLQAQKSSFNDPIFVKFNVINIEATPNSSIDAIVDSFQFDGVTVGMSDEGVTGASNPITLVKDQPRKVDITMRRRKAPFDSVTHNIWLQYIEESEYKPVIDRARQISTMPVGQTFYADNYKLPNVDDPTHETSISLQNAGIQPHKLSAGDTFNIVHSLTNTIGINNLGIETTYVQTILVQTNEAHEVEERKNTISKQLRDNSSIFKSSWTEKVKSAREEKMQAFLENPLEDAFAEDPIDTWGEPSYIKSLLKEARKSLLRFKNFNAATNEAVKGSYVRAKRSTVTNNHRLSGVEFVKVVQAYDALDAKVDESAATVIEPNTDEGIYCDLEHGEKLPLKITFPDDTSKYIIAEGYTKNDKVLRIKDAQFSAVSQKIVGLDTIIGEFAEDESVRIRSSDNRHSVELFAGSLVSPGTYVQVDEYYQITVDNGNLKVGDYAAGANIDLGNGVHEFELGSGWSTGHNFALSLTENGPTDISGTLLEAAGTSFRYQIDNFTPTLYYFCTMQGHKMGGKLHDLDFYIAVHPLTCTETDLNSDSGCALTITPSHPAETSVAGSAGITYDVSHSRQTESGWENLIHYPSPYTSTTITLGGRNVAGRTEQFDFPSITSDSSFTLFVDATDTCGNVINYTRQITIENVNAAPTLASSTTVPSKIDVIDDNGIDISVYEFSDSDGFENASVDFSGYQSVILDTTLNGSGYYEITAQFDTDQGSNFTNGVKSVDASFQIIDDTEGSSLVYSTTYNVHEFTFGLSTQIVTSGTTNTITISQPAFPTSDLTFSIVGSTSIGTLSIDGTTLTYDLGSSSASYSGTESVTLRMDYTATTPSKSVEKVFQMTIESGGASINTQSITGPQTITSDENWSRTFTIDNYDSGQGAVTPINDNTNLFTVTSNANTNPTSPTITVERTANAALVSSVTLEFGIQQGSLETVSSIDFNFTLPLSFHFLLTLPRIMTTNVQNTLNMNYQNMDSAADTVDISYNVIKGVEPSQVELLSSDNSKINIIPAGSSHSYELEISLTVNVKDSDGNIIQDETRTLRTVVQNNQFPTDLSGAMVVRGTVRASTILARAGTQHSR